MGIKKPCLLRNEEWPKRKERLTQQVHFRIFAQVSQYFLATPPLERAQNDRDVLEPLGECKCDPGMSVRAYGCQRKNTEGTIYCTQFFHPSA